ncbi:hypothetical protein P3J6_120723 [Pseudoalteromonas sp. 3J6]|nr:hypothetical protein P3J6_120723 [Pseudoalteromonas sp. 3J6]
MVFSEEHLVNAFEKRPQSQQALITDNNLRDNLHIKAGITRGGDLKLSG